MPKSDETNGNVATGAVPLTSQNNFMSDTCSVDASIGKKFQYLYIIGHILGEHIKVGYFNHSTRLEILHFVAAIIVLKS
jgi:hypothetical protein